MIGIVFRGIFMIYLYYETLRNNIGKSSGFYIRAAPRYPSASEVRPTPLVSGLLAV